MPTPAILLVPAERKQLASIREFVAVEAGAAGLNPRRRDDLVQAVDEAATNIIVHGYRDGPGMIEVEVRVEQDRVVVYLRDQAPPFNPEQVPPPDLSLPLELRPVGGLGVHMIRKCVDSFEHRAPEEGGNELKLCCDLPEPDSTGAASRRRGTKK